jgi:signal peptidase I
MTSSPGSDRVFAALQGLAREAPVEVCVRGDCMAPHFADGDRVRVAAARVYWPGDVVVFRAPDGRLLAHRLLGYRLWKQGPWRDGFALVTRGDACIVHDSPVPKAAVLGRVDAARPSFRGRAEAILGFLGLVLRRLGSG